MTLEDLLLCSSRRNSWLFWCSIALFDTGQWTFLQHLLRLVNAEQQITRAQIKKTISCLCGSRFLFGLSIRRLCLLVFAFALSLWFLCVSTCRLLLGRCIKRFQWTLSTSHIHTSHHHCHVPHFMDIEPRELRPLCDVIKIVQHFAVVNKIVFQIVIAYVFQSPFLFLFLIQSLFQRLFTLSLRLCLKHLSLPTRRTVAQYRPVLLDRRSVL